MIGRDLLLGLLFVGAVLVPLRYRLRPPALGPPGPARACAGSVEEPDGKVRCLAAPPPGVQSGDRVGGRPGRMAPARLGAFGVPVDVNRASREELLALDGVGPRLAATIEAARPFGSIDEVARVRGIGARRLAGLRPRLRLSTGER
jgi:hypothetical protein